MAKYDASGDRIKCRFPVFSIILLILGIVLIVAGAFYIRSTDMSQYYKSTDISESYAADGIDNLSVEFGFGDLLIDKSSDENIHVEGKNIPEDIELKTVGNTFEIKRKHKNIDFWDFPIWNWGVDKEEISLKIYLPEKIYRDFDFDFGAGDIEINNATCTNAEFDFGAGNCKINSFVCDYASFDQGAGDCDINRITVNKTLELDSGAGSMTVKNGVLSGMDVDIGAGDLDFSGTINGDIGIDVGAGDCTFTLTNPESDYRFVGNGEKRYGSDSGKYTVDIDRGAGDIDFIFGK